MHSKPSHCEDGLIPDLTFPDAKFGERQTPWNLNVLLYKDGPEARADCVQAMITSGQLGRPLLERLPLVVKLHQVIKRSFGAGGASDSVQQQINCLRYLFGFADRTSSPLTLSTVLDTYYAYADELVYRTNQKSNVPALHRAFRLRTLGKKSAYAYAWTVAAMLDKALERSGASVLEHTRIRHPRRSGSATGREVEKQSLSNTFSFGHMVQDICDGLPIETTNEAPLPLELMLRSGQKITVNVAFFPFHQADQLESIGNRYPVPNLRVEAELHMFIAQTAMNLAQAVKLKVDQFIYESYIDGYRVRTRKGRRKGPVLFNIFSEYREHFERYLKWRQHFFPKSNDLFPFIGLKKDATTRPSLHRLRAICKGFGTKYIGPRLMRGTRVNWLLRRTGDPALTSDIAQATVEVLHRSYDKKSYQRTMVETAHFWAKNDPHKVRTEAVAPGECTGKPSAVADIPKEATRPDCTVGSGCLWCQSHRDVDSLDYIWAMTTFKRLKVIELSTLPRAKEKDDTPPAKLAIDRIDAKLRWFDSSNDLRHSWVEEAHLRIAEGIFHANFKTEIEELGGAA